jgi:hypothetical protein
MSNRDGRVNPNTISVCQGGYAADEGFKPRLSPVEFGLGCITKFVIKQENLDELKFPRYND